MNEFDVIDNYFRPLTMGKEGAGYLQDDAAVLSVPLGFELVVTSDTLNAGTHFLADDGPENIARKALRVNLSDLAAMGATPMCYQLNIAFAEKPSEEWLARFTTALALDQKEFGIYCSGGDTTTILGGYLSISITAMGLVPFGKAVRRGGACDGDAIILTGPVGDAALGLTLLKNSISKAGEYIEAVNRYRVPYPMVKASPILREYANAAADISDGFLADLGHIAQASGVGARIDLDRVVYSPIMNKAFQGGLFDPVQALSGGDDYELVLSVSQHRVSEFISEMNKIELYPFVVGSFSSKCTFVDVIGNGSSGIDLNLLGWKHF